MKDKAPTWCHSQERLGDVSSLTAVNVCSDQGLSSPEPKQGLKLNLLYLNIL